MARYLAQNGVTSFAPASMTLPYDVLETAYKTAVRLRNEQPSGCARLMGIQMEGPFFSEKKKGAQNAVYLRNPDFDAFKRLYDVSEGLIRITDVAAELPGAVEFAEKHLVYARSPSRTPTARMKRLPPSLTQARAI